MREVFESVIKKGGYDLPAMLKKIDAYHISGKLTDADRDALYALARGSADPSVNLDLLAKVMDLEDRVKKLEEAASAGEEDTDTTEQPAEYVPGKWYRSGNRVTFEGVVYVCTVPESAVCTWSPAEYPAYWEAE